jgi:dihydrofolate reductase
MENVMRELTYYAATSLDGRIAAPDGGFDAFPTTGDHMEMIVREWRDTVVAPALEALGLCADGTKFDAVVMGWLTYEAGLPYGVVDPYPHLEQVVFSRSHGQDEVPDNVRIVSGDPVAEVQRLKREDGVGVWLCGGGRLAAALVDEIDRMVLKVNPVVLGDGVPLFAGGYDARAFELVRSTPYTSGVVVSEYARQRR